jgi:DNA gyrase/topoisomerase IV subunit B
MTPEELAQNFVRQFDKFRNDDKAICLDEIASIFSVKYDLNLKVEIEVNDDYLDVTESYVDEHTLPLGGTQLKFIWDV